MGEQRARMSRSYPTLAARRSPRATRSICVLDCSAGASSGANGQATEGPETGCGGYRRENRRAGDWRGTAVKGLGNRHTKGDIHADSLHKETFLVDIKTKRDKRWKNPKRELTLVDTGMVKMLGKKRSQNAMRGYHPTPHKQNAEHNSCQKP